MLLSTICVSFNSTDFSDSQSPSKGSLRPLVKNPFSCAYPTRSVKKVSFISHNWKQAIRIGSGKHNWEWIQLCHITALWPWTSYSINSNFLISKVVLVILTVSQLLEELIILIISCLMHRKYWIHVMEMVKMWWHRCYYHYNMINLNKPEERRRRSLGTSSFTSEDREVGNWLKWIKQKLLALG